MNCSCGNLTSTVICSSNSGMNNALLADHIRDLNNGNSSTINFKDLAISKKTDRLDCNKLDHTWSDMLFCYNYFLIKKGWPLLKPYCNSFTKKGFNFLVQKSD